VISRRLVSGAAIAVLSIVAVSRCDDPPKPSTAATPASALHARATTGDHSGAWRVPRSAGSQAAEPATEAGLPAPRARLAAGDAVAAGEPRASAASRSRLEREARRALRRVLGSRRPSSSPDLLYRLARRDAGDTADEDREGSPNAATVELTGEGASTAAKVAALHRALALHGTTGSPADGIGEDRGEPPPARRMNP
jgi:hypothetical protein